MNLSNLLVSGIEKQATGDLLMKVIDFLAVGDQMIVDFYFGKNNVNSQYCICVPFAEERILI